MKNSSDEKIYIAIDLKSFYASVECVERGLDPLTTNLVVADASRTEKTICLAVSPSLKSYGISGRARLFEVLQAVERVNNGRAQKLRGKPFTGESSQNDELQKAPSLKLSFITAPPQMQHYMDVSSKIYSIYLHYAAAKDIHVYSIDEVFIDATDYIRSARCTVKEYAMRMIRDVFAQTGITATAGIAPNLYLCKVAMDIVAKHIPADENGVRIAELDEMSYRRQLWNHTPLTDFWRIGKGTARKLEEHGMHTMGDVARMSVHAEEILYRLFGVNAEFIIDHAWGWEPCTIDAIKRYQPSTHSLSNGQVLARPYTFSETRNIVLEMAHALVLELVEKGLVTDQLELTICYDGSNLINGETRNYVTEIKPDYYGKAAPKNAHSTIRLVSWTSSTRLILKKTEELYREITNPKLLVRRIYIAANHLKTEQEAAESQAPEQLSLFGEAPAEKEQMEKEALLKEKKQQQVMLEIQKKYGKNMLLRGFDVVPEGTTRERNSEIGGHRK